MRLQTKSHFLFKVNMAHYYNYNLKAPPKEGNDKGRSKSVTDNEIELAYRVWKLHLQGKMNTEISKELELTGQKVTWCLAKARETYAKEIQDATKGYFGEIYARYENLYAIAMKEWQETKNPVFMREMRNNLVAMRQMLGTDAAPKAALSPEGKVVAPQQLLIVMDASGYEAKENEMKSLPDPNVIDGEAREV